MTPSAQRIAIAEACGWTDGGGASNWPHHGYRKGAGKPESPEPLPDYLSDLNAMHEAELECIYSRGLGMVYLHKLTELVNAAPGFDYGVVHIKRWNASATAAQRAEAFLHTLNLWKE